MYCIPRIVEDKGSKANPFHFLIFPDPTEHTVQELHLRRQPGSPVYDRMDIRILLRKPFHNNDIPVIRCHTEKQMKHRHRIHACCHQIVHKSFDNSCLLPGCNTQGKQLRRRLLYSLQIQTVSSEWFFPKNRQQVSEGSICPKHQTQDKKHKTCPDHT